MILSLDGDVSLEAGGGKGANLARLAHAGFVVPPGFVISIGAYRMFLAHNNLAAVIARIAGSAHIDSTTSLDASSAKIRALFAAGAIPTALADAIVGAYAALGNAPVAVRSSATTEDLPELSFAGQHDTVLNVIGVAPLLHAVVDCWSSLWTARAIGYRVRNAIAHEAAALAVVVQQMIPAEVSGVLFTANPLTGNRSEAVIEATFGLGEALVSGRVEPDHYLVGGVTARVLERRLGAKALSIRSRAEGGITEVAESAADIATLSDSEVLELAGTCRRVAQLFGSPQDIEWARAAGAFHLLQSRPITSLFPVPAEVTGDGLRVLLSIGAIQGMLDPLTPLGRDVFRVSLVRTLASIGAPLAIGQRPVVAAGDRIFVDITAVALNPKSRSRLRSVLQVIEPTTGKALDDMAADAAFFPIPATLPLCWPTWRFVWLITRAMGNMTYNLLWPDRGRVRIQRRLSSTIAAFTQRSAAAQTLRERVDLLDHAFAWIGNTGLAVLGPGFGSGLANLKLLHMLATPLPDGEQRVLELTRGLPHNVTTEMDLALWDVARAIRSDASAARYFAAADPGALARECLEGRLPSSVQKVIESFLETYGMRGVAEIDVGRIRWRDDPVPLMQALQSYLRIDDAERAPDAIFRRGAEAAARTLDALLSDLRTTRLGWLKAWVMTFAMRRMRALAGLRESPKFTMITMLGIARASLLAGGRELVAAGVVDAPDDVFFLRFDELRALSEGPSGDWRACVQERRESYAREKRRRRVPRLLLSDGRVFLGGAAASPSTNGAGGVEGSILVGTPVSPGVTVGVVRVVFDPGGAQLTPGEILVCPGTDPAWTPLFLAAAGLVTEVGGLMTHGSVVAREYGIPAVVGVHDATTRLRSGDRVQVDGTTGIISILPDDLARGEG